MLSEGLPYKLTECQTCGACSIMGSTNHAPKCHGERQRKIAGLATKPVAAYIAGRWIISNVTVPKPKDDSAKEIRRYSAIKSKIAIALMPGMPDAEEINYDSAVDMFRLKIFQVSRESCGMKYHGASYESEDVINAARSFVFTPDFEDICEFIGVKPDAIREALIRKWAGIERFQIEDDGDEFDDTEDDEYIEYDLEDLQGALNHLNGFQEAVG